MTSDTLLIAAFVAAAVFVVGALWLIARAPMLDESDADDDRRISEILAASKPMPIEPRPHIRAGTWREEA